MRKRIAIIGLDGVSPSFLNYLFEGGYMPFVYSIAQRGVYGGLKSLVPTCTAAIWTSIFTGVNPGKHGIYTFLDVKRNPGAGFQLRVVNSDMVMYPRIFEILDICGISSLVVNVAVTFPPQSLVTKRSLVVSDWLGPRVEIVPKKFSNYVQCFRSLTERAVREDIPDRMYENLAQKVAGLLELAEKVPFEVLITVFNEPDIILHKVPEVFEERRKLSECAKIFTEIDKFIREVASQVDAIFILSDHGFKVYTRVLRPMIPLLKNRYAKMSIVRREKRSPREKVVSIPPMLLKFFSKPILKSIASKVFRAIYPHKKTTYKYETDLEHSQAFMPDNNVMYTTPSSLTAIHSLLVKELSRYGVRVVFGKEFYWGPYVERGPDLVILSDEYYIDTGIVGPVKENKKILDHSLDALFIAYGEDVIKGRKLELSCLDVAPTILAYLGIPIPHDIDGKVRAEIFSNKISVRFDSGIVVKWLLAKRAKKAYRK